MFEVNRHQMGHLHVYMPTLFLSPPFVFYFLFWALKFLFLDFLTGSTVLLVLSLMFCFINFWLSWWDILYLHCFAPAASHRLGDKMYTHYCDSPRWTVTRFTVSDLFAVWLCTTVYELCYILKTLTVNIEGIVPSLVVNSLGHTLFFFFLQLFSFF